MTLRAFRLIGLILLLAANPALALDTSERGLYAQMLDTYTGPASDLAGTRVDYAGLARDPRWRETVAQLEATPAALRTSREQRLAFWINAYNIYAIDVVVKNLPVSSIRDIGNFFRPVWRRTVGTLDGKSVTLDGIEHQTLRPMGDPRIHAAIVCASLSCPSLRRVPFTPEGIDAELDAAAETWLANPKKGLAVDREQNQLRISKIFDWSEADFEARGGVRGFVTRYAPPAERNWLETSGTKARIRYFDYDWHLNGMATAPRPQ